MLLQEKLQLLPEILHNFRFAEFILVLQMYNLLKFNDGIKNEGKVEKKNDCPELAQKSKFYK